MFAWVCTICVTHSQAMDLLHGTHNLRRSQKHQQEEKWCSDVSVPSHLYLSMLKDHSPAGDNTLKMWPLHHPLTDNMSFWVSHYLWTSAPWCISNRCWRCVVHRARLDLPGAQISGKGPYLTHEPHKPFAVMADTPGSHYITPSLRTVCCRRISHQLHQAQGNGSPRFPFIHFKYKIWFIFWHELLDVHNAHHTQVQHRYVINSHCQFCVQSCLVCSWFNLGTT